jgi:hypothetical protein
MDDVRLFTREYAVARRALLLIDQTIRSLHLNLQSAKTEILAETPNKEITARLIDRRIDEINFVIEKIQEKKYKLTDRESLILEEKLYEIAKARPYSRFETKLIGSQKPLRGLTVRAFHRWLTAHSMLKGSYYVRFLLRELKRNPDYRLTRKLISITRRRSRLQSIISPLFNFIKSDLNLFPHQHAEILWAFRYLSRIPPEVIQHCEELIFNENTYYYVRGAAALLLSRTVLEKRFIDRCRDAFHRADDTNVRIALSVLLMQSTGKVGAATLQILVLHPNDKIRRVARIFAEVRSDTNEAKKRLKFLFGSDNDWILYDQMGILFSMSQSDQPDILRELINLTTSASQKSPRLDMRLTLAKIANRANIRLANVLKLAKFSREVVVRIAS